MTVAVLPSVEAINMVPSALHDRPSTLMSSCKFPLRSRTRIIRVVSRSLGTGSVLNCSSRSCLKAFHNETEKSANSVRRSRGKVGPCRSKRKWLLGVAVFSKQ